MLREQRKNVHAFAVGHLLVADELVDVPGGRPAVISRIGQADLARFAGKPHVGYSPYVSSEFYRLGTRERVREARAAFFTPGGVLVCDLATASFPNARSR